MKRNILVSILGLLLLVGCASTQPTSTETVCDCSKSVQVTDKAFRIFLADNGFAEKTGWRKMKPTAEGCALKVLECYEKGIHSLQGIEMFPQLEQVICSDNPISELNLNALTKLQKLYALNVPLQKIDLSRCQQLTNLQLSYTHLDSIDLTPLHELRELLCIFSPIKAVDLSPCPKLNLIYLRATQIKEIDIRPCLDLWQIHALDTPLQHLIVNQTQYSSDLKVSVEDTVKIIVR